MKAPIHRLITSPNQFLAHEQADPTLRGSVLVVGLTGILYAMSGVVFFPIRIQQYQADAMIYLYAGVAFSAVATVLLTFLLWVFYAGSFLVIGTLLFDAGGEFRNVLILVGWGFIGQLLAGGVSLLSRLYYLQRIGLSAQPAALGQIQSQPVLLLASFVGFAAFLWSAFLWTYAVQHALYLPLYKSVATVGAPVALSAVVFYGFRFLSFGG